MAGARGRVGRVVGEPGLRRRCLHPRRLYCLLDGGSGVLRGGLEQASGHRVLVHFLLDFYRLLAASVALPRAQIVRGAELAVRQLVVFLVLARRAHVDILWRLSLLLGGGFVLVCVSLLLEEGGPQSHRSCALLLVLQKALLQRLHLDLALQVQLLACQRLFTTLVASLRPLHVLLIFDCYFPEGVELLLVSRLDLFLILEELLFDRR